MVKLAIDDKLVFEPLQRIDDADEDMSVDEQVEVDVLDELL